MNDQLAGLTGEWALWRDCALRSAGFPVRGLDVFGSDESAGLRAVAGDPAFREAVTWQNREALHNAVDKVAAGSPTGASTRRRREEVVANYWQRYCAKNETIGFFGPLAWGRLADSGPAVAYRAGRVDAQRSVHFEQWAIEALAQSLGLPDPIPLGPHPERDLRIRLQRSPHSDDGLAALDLLESRRSAVAEATRDKLDAALAHLDRTFVELTRQEPWRKPGEAYGARTPVYLDCLRDLQLSVGPGMRDEMAGALPALLASSRWYCDRIFDIGRTLMRDAIGERMASGPTIGRILGELMRIPAQVHAVTAQLQTKWAQLLHANEPQTLVERASQVFASGGPGWPLSVYHSPDVQIAAASALAIEGGDFLSVVGDFHPGANPLCQGMFATRHPDREQFVTAIHTEVGRPIVFLIPPRNVPRMTSRVMPAFTEPTDIHVAATPGACMPDGFPTIDVGRLLIDGEDVVEPTQGIRFPLIELLSSPLFMAAIRTWDPFPTGGHAPRITVGRTVLRRETWNVVASNAPQHPQDLPGWARALGMPRRVFAKSPLEDKPVYIDFTSPILMRTTGRMLRHAAAATPQRPVRFTEMLPTPDQCWLRDDDGDAFTSELRLVCVDLTRRAGTTS
ncbi:MAG TPA: lantibiotic dehydratase [Kribbellaceae bacterium]